jgi:hypothetical protein
MLEQGLQDCNIPVFRRCENFEKLKTFCFLLSGTQFEPQMAAIPLKFSTNKAKYNNINSNCGK